MTTYVIKSSGHQEPFNINKFTRSLHKAGATQEVIDRIAFEIQQQPELQTTREIYNFALQRLRTLQRTSADRYNLKNALFELGPTGFPFEQFIAKIFQALGHTTFTDTIVQGKCVAHEVDLITRKDNNHCIVECKFHHRYGIKTDVKTALYVQARVQDLASAHTLTQKEHHTNWIVTNTTFTSQAIQYAECVGIHLLGWSFPQENNLPHLIDKFGLYPITCLTSLTFQQKRALIQEGFLLCKDAPQYEHALKKLHINPDEAQSIIKESCALCQ